MAVETSTSSIVINRPVPDVFAYVENVRTMPDYLKFVREAAPVSGNPGEIGYTIRVASDVAGRSMENKSELTEYEEHKRTTYRSRKPITMSITHEYEEADGGATKLTRTTTADMETANFFFKLAGPMLVKSVAKETEAGLARLKEILEGQA